jgi:tetratricopeptide (TPR) repeat protein
MKTAIHIFVALTFFAIPTQVLSQRRAAPTTVSSTAITIRTEPNAIVWVDEIRRGTTAADGKLALSKVLSGRHTVRVRAMGFKETTVPFVPVRGSQMIHLPRTTDQAELKFQQAESAHDGAKTDEARNQAVELYREALKLRPAFPTAHLGLARLLTELNKNEAALGEIEVARRTRPSYAEASAVEGRIYREMAFLDEAVKSFNRSLREANGFQPEAHVGLARVYEDRGQYERAAAEYQTAIKQLSDAEPVIYQMWGATLERLEKYKEAVAAYEKFLELAPTSSLAPAVRSILDQVKREAAGREIVP